MIISLPRKKGAAGGNATNHPRQLIVVRLKFSLNRRRPIHTSTAPVRSRRYSVISSIWKHSSVSPSLIPEKPLMDTPHS